MLKLISENRFISRCLTSKNKEVESDRKKLSLKFTRRRVTLGAREIRQE